MCKDIFSCKNKIAVVTGGSGLIGKEIVRALYEFGATVYVADIIKNKSEGLNEDTSVKNINLDISSKDSVQDVIENIVKNDGRIDILVNSAYPRTKDWGLKFENVTFDSWKENVHDHLGGYFLCCQRVAEQMKKQLKAELKKSYKLHTRRDSKNIYRNVISVRFT